MPKDLYEQVKDDIPAHIGVYTESSYCLKKAKKQELGEDEQVLKNSLIRSLAREADKVFKSGNPTVVDGMNRRLSRMEQEKNKYREMYQSLQREVYDKFGTRWRYE